MITQASGSGCRLNGSGPCKTDIHDWIKTVVVATIREMTPKLFGTIKAKQISLFYERYVVVASIAAVSATIVVAATVSFRDKGMPYREPNNTKPP